MPDRSPIPGPYAVLVVPEADFFLDRSQPLARAVLDPDGRIAADARDDALAPAAVAGLQARPAVRVAALATFETRSKHGQLAATVRAMSADDRGLIAARLRQMADYIERVG